MSPRFPAIAIDRKFSRQHRMTILEWHRTSRLTAAQRLSRIVPLYAAKSSGDRHRDRNDSWRDHPWRDLNVSGNDRVRPLLEDAQGLSRSHNFQAGSQSAQFELGSS